MGGGSKLAALARELVLAERELAGLAAQPEPWSVESFVGEHAPQGGFVRDRSQWQHVKCARQSGKSWGGAGKLFDNAGRNPRSVNVLLGLNGPSVRENFWEPVWKPLLWKYGIPKRCYNETRMSTHLDNGSRIMLGGTSNWQHIRNQLGKRLENGLFIVDEAQDQPAKRLDPLIDHILPPMMTPGTQVVLSGTIPEVPAGRFYNETVKPTRPWSFHNWGRFANVHTPEARAQFEQYVRDIGMAAAWAMAQELTTDEKREEFEKYLRDNGLTSYWSILQRDWMGLSVFDPSATAFRYVQARNGYDGAAFDGKRFVGHVPPEFLAKLTTYSVGVDPGAFDRCAIVVVAWGPGTGLWVIEEWVTDRNAGTVWSQIGTELGRIQKAYGPAWYFADFGGSKMTLDVFGRDHGVPVVHAAKKAERRWQVDRCNDLMMRADCWIPIGSQLEGDLTKTQWDKDGRQRGEWEWSSANHPDVADAFRYASHPYLELHEKQTAAVETGPSIAQRLAALKAKADTKSYFEQKRRQLAQ